MPAVFYSFSSLRSSISFLKSIVSSCVYYHIHHDVYHPGIDEVTHILQCTNIGNMKSLFTLISCNAHSELTLVLNKIEHINIFIEFVGGVIQLIV